VLFFACAKQGSEATNGVGAVVGTVVASSVKRPDAAAVDRYVHGKLLPAYANHIQVTNECTFGQALFLRTCGRSHLAFLSLLPFSSFLPFS
jgi:hypothetical protein